MKDEIKELLDERIKSQLEEVEKLEKDSEEYDTAIENLNTLYKLRIEEEKLESNSDIAVAEAEQKAEHDEKQSKLDKLKLGVELLGIGLPLIFYGVYLHKGFKLEYVDKGMVCSPTFKNLISNFKPRRK